MYKVCTLMAFADEKAQTETEKKAILPSRNTYPWHALSAQFRNTYATTILQNLLTRCRKDYNTTASMHILRYCAEVEVHAYIFKTSYIADCQHFILQHFCCISFIQLTPETSAFGGKCENKVSASCIGSRHHFVTYVYGNDDTSLESAIGLRT